MKSAVKKGRGAFILIVSLALSLFLIDRLYLAESRILHIAGTLSVFLFYSFLFYIILKPVRFRSAEKGLEYLSEEENSDPGILIPLEDESDLGELIEVGGDIPPFNPFQTEVLEKIAPMPAAVPVPADPEPLEELEAFEEPVEELEAIDD
ncbi:MAG: hypothetical protein JXR86_01080 [Spirochaetales bacterium]|nr:hypothetical protein [Spirochaetales bacterium]